MKSCLALLLLPLALVLTLVRACNQAGAPQPVMPEGVENGLGNWRMKHHDASPDRGYEAGKSFTLHADGRAECRGLQRRDLGEDVNEPGRAVPAQGEWQLDGKALRLHFTECVSPQLTESYGGTAHFYRKDGYSEGPLELWFTFGDPDNLQWAQYVREP